MLGNASMINEDGKAPEADRAEIFEMDPPALLQAMREVGVLDLFLRTHNIFKRDGRYWDLDDGYLTFLGKV